MASNENRLAVDGANIIDSIPYHDMKKKLMNRDATDEEIQISLNVQAARCGTKPYTITEHRIIGLIPGGSIPGSKMHEAIEKAEQAIGELGLGLNAAVAMAIRQLGASTDVVERVLNAPAKPAPLLGQLNLPEQYIEDILKKMGYCIPQFVPRKRMPWRGVFNRAVEYQQAPQPAPENYYSKHNPLSAIVADKHATVTITAVETTRVEETSQSQASDTVSGLATMGLPLMEDSVAADTPAIVIKPEIPSAAIQTTAIEAKASQKTKDTSAVPSTTLAAQTAPAEEKKQEVTPEQQLRDQKSLEKLREKARARAERLEKEEKEKQEKLWQAAGGDKLLIKQKPGEPFIPPHLRKRV